MGQRGPKPKPLGMKLLTGGTIRPGDRAGIIMPPGELKMPTGLSKAAKAAWVRTVAAMPPGVLTPADRDVLAAYCGAVADLEELTRVIDRDGLILEVDALDRNGKPTGAKIKRVHPAAKLKADASNRVRQLAAEFGLSPASRSRVPMPEVTGNKPVNKITELAARIQAARAAPLPGG
jgi:P27 family predicted phage terminase small subunit